MAEITRQMLRDYLHDALPDAELAAVEKALRESAKLRAVYKDVVEQEDRGEHTVGAIWRRERVSCLSREQLGSFLLGAGDPELLDYIESPRARSQPWRATPIRAGGARPGSCLRRPR